MKILIFSQHFWPENFRINDIAESLSCLGHDVEILTGKPNYPEGIFFQGYSGWGFQKDSYKDISVYRIPILSRGSKKCSIRLALNYLSFIFSGLFFAPFLLRKKKYDVVFVYGVSPIFVVLPASFFGWLRKIPVVLWVQDLWPQSAEATGYIKSPFLLKLLEFFVKLSYRNSDLILAQSKTFIKPISFLAPNKSIIYYPNSVRKDFYLNNNVSKIKIDSLKSGFNILFAGNIGEAQSIETIVSAAEILKPFKNIKIIIIGSGSKLGWLSNEIKNKSLSNIFIEGRYPVETMPSILRQASALLVTLKNKPIFSLTIPNKIQAYLAVGKPILACLNGEGAKIINEANAGISIEAEDHIALSDAIIKLYRMNKSDLLKFGRNGRKYFKSHFNEDILIKELEEHFYNISRNH